VHPGLSATVGEWINGATSLSQLYVAFAHQSDNQIGVIRLNWSYVITQAPKLIPSDRDNAYVYVAKTNQPLGLTTRKAAFNTSDPTPLPINYLYLTFVGLGGTTVYTSVLQNYSDTTPWFTKPMDSFGRVDAGTGAAWIVDANMLNGDVLAATYTQGQAIRKLVSYGRY
jgi:hypothetical protein